MIFDYKYRNKSEFVVSLTRNNLLLIMVTFKEFFSFKNNRFFWLNLVAMIIVVIAIALGTLQWLDNYTRHGEAVVVPNVKRIAYASGRE